MNLEKWTPWNWFRKEEPVEVAEGEVVDVPSLREDTAQSLHREFDRLFNRMIDDFLSFGRGVGGDGASLERVLRPRMNIAESEGEYRFEVELPGVDRQDLDVTVADGTLTLRGQKRAEKEEKGRRYHRVERSYGSFQRVLSLPEDADEEKVEASFDKGVLTITVARDPAARRAGRKIAIK